MRRVIVFIYVLSIGKGPLEKFLRTVFLYLCETVIKEKFNQKGIVVQNTTSQRSSLMEGGRRSNLPIKLFNISIM